MQLADLGFEIFPGDQQTPEALADYEKAEIAKWWPIIKAAGNLPHLSAHDCAEIDAEVRAVLTEVGTGEAPP